MGCVCGAPPARMMTRWSMKWSENFTSLRSVTKISRSRRGALPPRAAAPRFSSGGARDNHGRSTLPRSHGEHGGTSQPDTSPRGFAMQQPRLPAHRVEPLPRDAEPRGRLGAVALSPIQRAPDQLPLAGRLELAPRTRRGTGDTDPLRQGARFRAGPAQPEPPPTAAPSAAPGHFPASGSCAAGH